MVVVLTTDGGNSTALLNDNDHARAYVLAWSFVGGGVKFPILFPRKLLMIHPTYVSDLISYLSFSRVADHGVPAFVVISACH